MFLRRQDVIDRFDANFRTDPDGTVFFQPPGEDFGLPVPPELYDAIMAAFERVHFQNMVISWITILGAGGYGLFKLITEDTYLSFFIALGCAMVFNICLQIRDGLGLLLPLIAERERLEKAMPVAREWP